MENPRWLVYAVPRAVSASLINVFAKLGTRDLDADVQTAIRSIFQVAFVLIFCLAIGSYHKPAHVDARPVLFAAAAGVAGGLSWIFIFRAVALADVTLVAPIDKLSLPLGIILAVACLGERPTRLNWVGILLIVAGAYLATARKAHAGFPVNEPPAPTHATIGSDAAAAPPAIGPQKTNGT